MAAKEVAVIFADSHLAERAWKDRPIEGDSYFALDQITYAATQLKADAVIGAGDLLDRQLNRAGPIGSFNDNMDRLAGAEIPFYFIQGQHEMMTGRPWADVHHWPHHLSNRQRRIGPFDVWGLDYTPAPLLQIALGSIPAGTDIAILHQVWEEFMGVGNTDGRLTEIGTVGMAFTGDLHKLKKHNTFGRDGQALTVYSPGSTCMQSIDEPPDKHYLVLFDDGKVSSRKLKSRPHINLGVMASSEQLDNIIKSMPATLSAAWDSTVGYPEAVRAPTVRIVYQHFIQDAEKRMRAALGDRGHLFPKELSPDHVVVDGKALSTITTRGGNAVTLDSVLQEFLESRDLGGLYEQGRRLLNAPDVAAELRVMRDESVSA